MKIVRIPGQKGGAVVFRENQLNVRRFGMGFGTSVALFYIILCLLLLRACSASILVDNVNKPTSAHYRREHTYALALTSTHTHTITYIRTHRHTHTHTYVAEQLNIFFFGDCTEVATARAAQTHMRTGNGYKVFHSV